jgi:hypothetical protein
MMATARGLAGWLLSSKLSSNKQRRRLHIDGKRLELGRARRCVADVHRLRPGLRFSGFSGGLGRRYMDRSYSVTCAGLVCPMIVAAWSTSKLPTGASTLWMRLPCTPLISKGWTGFPSSTNDNHSDTSVFGCGATAMWNSNSVGAVISISSSAPTSGFISANDKWLRNQDHGVRGPRDRWAATRRS